MLCIRFEVPRGALEVVIWCRAHTVTTILPPVNAALLCKDSCLPRQIASLRALQLLVEGLEGLSQKCTDRM